MSDPIALQVLWNRLIFITDQADIALGRTAFSQIVREAHDYVTVLLDTAGSSLAQCTKSIPAFIGCLPLAAKHFLRAYPPQSLVPGDVLITNDPAIGTGHLPDITMLTPIFRHGRLVAYAGTIAHLPDVGGRPFSPDAVDVFEEGIRLPILKLYRAGEPNKDVLDIIAASVRVPYEVLGDIQSLVAANNVMAREVVAFMDEYDLEDLSRVANVIHARSEQTMREAISRMPSGVYRSEVRLDGFDSEVTITATVEVKPQNIHVDYTGSSPQVPFGINVYPNYRFAQTAYALKCLLDPETPNNEGCFKLITDSAPFGSILNPRPPAAGNSRMLVGQAIPGAIFKVLQRVVPERIVADSGGAPVWIVTLVGQDVQNRPFVGLYPLNGGLGGRFGHDGVDALSFPSNGNVTPVEMFEQAVPILIEEKELIADSGGPGEYRGGFGQRVVMRSMSGIPIMLYLSTERLKHPCTGVLGGQDGRVGAVVLDDKVVFGKGKQSLPPRGRLVLETPGGGGWGRPQDRNRDLVARDIQQGLVSVAQAKNAYGHKPIPP